MPEEINPFQGMMREKKEGRFSIESVIKSVQSVNADLACKECRQWFFYSELLRAVYDVIAGEKKYGKGRLDSALKLADISSDRMFIDDEIACLPCQEGRVYCIGDLHGDFKTLQTILLRLFGKCSPAGTSIGKRKSESKIVFLGDYIDRGSRSLDVIGIVLALKWLLPDQVVLLKGNHDILQFNPETGSLVPDWNVELDDTTLFSNILNDMGTPAEVQKLFALVLAQFSSLCLIIHPMLHVFAAHGGIPRPDDRHPEDYFHHIKTLSDFNRNPDLLDQMRWSDPEDKEDVLLTGNRRFTFAANHFRQFLDKFGADLFIRSHEPYSDGFKWLYERQLLTVFSTGGQENPDTYYDTVTPDILEIDYTNKSLSIVDVNPITQVFNVEPEGKKYFNMDNFRLCIACYSRNENFIRKILSRAFMDELLGFLDVKARDEFSPDILIYHNESPDFIEGVPVKDLEDFFSRNRQELIFSPVRETFWSGIEYLLDHGDSPDDKKIILALTDETWPPDTGLSDKQLNELRAKVSALNAFILVVDSQADGPPASKQSNVFKSGVLSGELKTAHEKEFRRAASVISREIKHALLSLQGQTTEWKDGHVVFDSGLFPRSIRTWKARSR